MLKMADIHRFLERLAVQMSHGRLTSAVKYRAVKK
jgi:hypothetical protein